MKREIRFRAWDASDKEMVDWWKLLRDPDDWFDGLVSGEADTGDVLMQYTGLKDKDGVEIYEGDIVRDSTGWQGEVRFGCVDGENNLNEVPITFVGWHVWGKDGQYYHFGSVTQSMIDGDVEVIGNIYENPKLLVSYPDGDREDKEGL